jgi:hypothetical protein
VSRDPAIRKLLCKLLTHPGYHTHQLAEMSQVDLETVTSLAALYPSLKVILLSALAAEQMPGSRVLPKPFRRELLLESVQNALAGRSRETRMPVTTSI